MMKRIWRRSAVLALVLSGCAAEAAPPSASLAGQEQAIVFGSDDRFDVAVHPDVRAQQWARSVAILGFADQICAGSDPDCNYTLVPVADHLPGFADDEPGLCPSEPFSDRSWMKGAKCTAFYVGSNRFITADHCFDRITNGQPDGRVPPEQLGVLFGFQNDANGNTPTSIPRAGNFYRIKPGPLVVRDRGAEPNLPIDYAIFEVDTTVSGHPALPLRRQGKVAAGPPSEPSTTPTPLAVMGFSTLMPMQTAFDGRVRNNLNNGWFYFTGDGMHGMSGGPIINIDTGFVEGVITKAPAPEAGEHDIDFNKRDDGLCYELRECHDDITGCGGPAFIDTWVSGLRVTRPQILANVPALPALPAEHTAIVLDATASMTLPGTSAALARWDDAINAAKQWVALDRVTAGLVSRGYTIWTFKESSVQHGLVQVWPLPDSSDCLAFDEATEFCTMTGDADYQALSDRLDAIKESHRPVDFDSITPLAASLCDAVTRVATLPTLKRIILESDGGENASLGACAGQDSQGFDVWDTSKLDWGMTEDSWQAKVIRRLVRIGESTVEAVVGQLTSSDVVPPSVSWLVDFHFGISQPGAFAGARVLTLDGSPELPAAGGVALALLAGPTLTPEEKSQGELDFFRGLGSASPGSHFTQYEQALDPDFGLDHAIEADADDSGCVDLADYRIVTDAATWLLRALPPSPGVRADVTRDSWVNEEDVAKVVAAWRTGCTGHVAEPPSCGNGKRDNNESDVDCGGSCVQCSYGESCGGALDCEAGSCAAGVCGCPKGMRVVLGTEGRDVLTGSEGADCIVGLGGDDVIDARGGNDVVFAGAGRDTVMGGLGDDQLFGDADDDILDGSTGDDLVLGQRGIDTCAGGTEQNRVSCEVAAHCTAACCASDLCDLP